MINYRNFELKTNVKYSLLLICAHNRCRIIKMEMEHDSSEAAYLCIGSMANKCRTSRKTMFSHFTGTVKHLVLYSDCAPISRFVYSVHHVYWIQRIVNVIHMTSEWEPKIKTKMFEWEQKQERLLVDIAQKCRILATAIQYWFVLMKCLCSHNNGLISWQTFFFVTNYALDFATWWARAEQK